jgi:hypothetical protein
VNICQNNSEFDSMPFLPKLASTKVARGHGCGSSAIAAAMLEKRMERKMLLRWQGDRAFRLPQPDLATWLAEQAEVIRWLLRHSTLVMTGHYVQPQQARLKSSTSPNWEWPRFPSKTTIAVHIAGAVNLLPKSNCIKMEGTERE